MSIRREDLKNHDFSEVATGEEIPSPHPGVFLREILDELALSQARLAEMIGVTPMRISHVVKGDRPLKAELAMKLGKLFGQTPEYWLNLQSSYDLAVAEHSPDLNLETIPKLTWGVLRRNLPIKKEEEENFTKDQTGDSSREIRSRSGKTSPIKTRRKTAKSRIDQEKPQKI